MSNIISHVSGLGKIPRGGKFEVELNESET
jgi:hypothetical protein